MVWFVMVQTVLVIALAVTLYRVYRQLQEQRLLLAGYQQRKRRQVDFLKSKLRDINLALGGICIYQRIAENQQWAERAFQQKTADFDNDKFRNGLYLNQKLLVRLCNIMEFPEPGQRKATFKPVDLADSFWHAFRNKDYAELRLYQQQLRNRNRCAQCLNSGTLLMDLRIKGVCGGCGAVSLVFDPVAIEQVKEMMTTRADQEAIWPDQDN